MNVSGRFVLAVPGLNGAALRVVLLLLSSACFAQVSTPLCDAGSGSLEMTVSTGVTVRVGAARAGDLATRACAASLLWEHQQQSVADSVAQLDVDALDVDLGWGIPIAAFQVRKQASDCCAAYYIYSLHKPPRMMRTLTGASAFRAADTDLDGRVEIWTDDAAVAAQFEGFALTEFDAPPMLVLRFEHGELLDVSAEFQSDFDQSIAHLRAGLEPASLQDFKASDGVLAAARGQLPEQFHRLRQTKAKVLQIAWSYLYSGREEEAWKTLGDLWPPSDVSRIRAALLALRAHGIRSQVDEGSPKTASRKKRVTIFDASVASSSGPTDLLPPKALLLWRPPASPDAAQPVSEHDRLLVLVIDAAGKVRSVQPVEKSWSDPGLLEAARQWKFIPAFHGGKPVASRFRMSVSMRR